MKTTLSLVCSFFLIVLNTFGQVENDPLISKHHRYRHEVSDKPTAPNEIKDPHNLNIGASDVSITTHDGQSPNEQQLNVIQNALVGDFLVNDDTTGGTANQVYPTIAIDGAGNFVIVWEDTRNRNLDIYYQRYDSSGTAVGVNTKVNDDAGTANQKGPSITMDAQGNFIIVWLDERIRYGDIYYQRYDSRGVVQGINTKANDDASYVEYSASVAMDGDGNFVIVWDDRRNGDEDIYYQRFDSSGTEIGVNTKANDDTGREYQLSPSIAMDQIGNFVIAWSDERRDGYTEDIYYQRYNNKGIAQGENTKANNDNGNFDKETPSISMDGSGNFVIVWRDDQNIYYQRYDSSGAAQGINTKANDNTSFTLRYYPSVAMDGSGNFVIVWQDNRDGGWDIFYQRYNTSGIPQGVNLKANEETAGGRQKFPSIAMDGAGNSVIVWERYYDVQYADIYFQRYDHEGRTQVVNTKVDDDAGSANRAYPLIAMDGTGNFVIVWEDYRTGNYSANSDIYFQRYNSYGIAQGKNTKAGDEVAISEWQGYPSIVMDSVGNFVNVWVEYTGIYYQR